MGQVSSAPAQMSRVSGFTAETYSTVCVHLESPRVPEEAAPGTSAQGVQ